MNLFSPPLSLSLSLSTVDSGYAPKSQESFSHSQPKSLEAYSTSQVTHPHSHTHTHSLTHSLAGAQSPGGSSSLWRRTLGLHERVPFPHSHPERDDPQTNRGSPREEGGGGQIQGVPERGAGIPGGFQGSPEVRVRFLFQTWERGEFRNVSSPFRYHGETTASSGRVWWVWSRFRQGTQGG